MPAAALICPSSSDLTSSCRSPFTSQKPSAGAAFAYISKRGLNTTVYVTNDFGFLRGEIYYADLDPHYGSEQGGKRPVSEQGGKRPVIVIQNNTGNKFAPTVIVAAVTSKVTKKPNQPTHVLIDRNPAFSRPSMVLLEQIFTIDKERIQRLLGQTTPDEMYQINEALMNSLDLNGGR